jgi:probable HAF family extracellular repeat protein
MKEKLILVAAIVAILFAAPETYAITLQILGPMSTAYGDKAVLVSDDGNTVLATVPGNTERDDFLWTVSGGITQIYSRHGDFRPTTLSSDGQSVFGHSSTYGGSSIVIDTSSDGQIAACYSGNQGGEAYRAAIGQPIIWLGDLPGGDFFSVPTGISADGSTIVGISAGAFGYQPFRWTLADGMQPLGSLPGAPRPTGYAQGVSANGQVIVGFALTSTGSNTQAFRWTAATGLEGLGDPPTGIADSSAYAISADGNTIVGRIANANRLSAFIWDHQNGMRRLEELLTTDFGLNLGLIQLNVATDISTNGRIIVGTGWSPDTGQMAWRLDLGEIPEPATSSLLLMATMCLGICFPLRKRSDSSPAGCSRKFSSQPWLQSQPSNKTSLLAASNHFPGARSSVPRVTRARNFPSSSNQIRSSAKKRR